MTLTNLYLDATVVLFLCVVILAVWLVYESRDCDFAEKLLRCVKSDFDETVKKLGEVRTEAANYKADAEAWKKAHDLLIKPATTEFDKATSFIHAHPPSLSRERVKLYSDLSRAARSGGFFDDAQFLAALAETPSTPKASKPEAKPKSARIRAGK